MPSGFLDVTPAAVSEAQRNAILARKLSQERIQPRHNNFPHLRQFTVHQVENQATLYYVLNQLQGTAQPYVAYTPEALFGRSPHNGVTVPLPDLGSGSHTITYRWTIPASNDPVLVDVQPTDLREPEIAYQTILEVSWSITIEVPGLGDQIFQGANNLDFFEASWEAAGADGGALPDGVYTVQVRAEIASDGLVAEKSFPYVIGTGQTGVLVENLTSDPNPVDFEEQPEGMKGRRKKIFSPLSFKVLFSPPW